MIQTKLLEDTTIQFKEICALKTYLPFNQILSSVKFGLAITLVLAFICKKKSYNLRVTTDRLIKIKPTYNYSGFGFDVTAILWAKAKNNFGPVDINAF